MCKEKKYRIVTDGGYFRIQSQRSFLGIKWWKFDENDIAFIHFSNVKQMMENYEDRERCSKEIRSKQKEARKEVRRKTRKKLWKPIEKENQDVMP